MVVGYWGIGGLSVPCLIKFLVSHIFGAVPDDLEGMYEEVKIVCAYWGIS